MCARTSIPINCQYICKTFFFYAFVFIDFRQGHNYRRVESSSCSCVCFVFLLLLFEFILVSIRSTVIRSVWVNTLCCIDFCEPRSDSLFVALMHVDFLQLSSESLLNASVYIRVRKKMHLILITIIYIQRSWILCTMTESQSRHAIFTEIQSTWKIREKKKELNWRHFFLSRNLRCKTKNRKQSNKSSINLWLCNRVWLIDRSKFKMLLCTLQKQCCMQHRPAYCVFVAGWLRMCLFFFI